MDQYEATPQEVGWWKGGLFKMRLRVGPSGGCGPAEAFSLLWPRSARPSAVLTVLKAGGRRGGRRRRATKRPFSYRFRRQGLAPIPPSSSSRTGSSDLAKRGLAAILGWQWDKRYPRLLEISPDSTSLTSGGRFFICILFTVVILSLAKLRFEGSNQRFPPTAFFHRGTQWTPMHTDH